MRPLFLIVITWMLGTPFMNAQGCSDAGICSAGNSFDNTEKVSKNMLETGGIYGAGESDVIYFSPYVTYTWNVNNKLSLSSKITYSVASGSFGQRGALGDAYLIGNYKWKAATTKQWSTLIGFKIPFNSSNLKINDYSIPMDYQASLGTLDLIAGVNLNYKKWDLNAGIQVPLFQNNKNSYFKEYSGTDDFPSTNLFKRKPDALFRTTYTVKTSDKKFAFKPNILFLYHLGEDSFENIFSKRETIKDSDGLTINGNLIAAYAINTKKSIELSLAAPFVVRDVRPDGLTRKFTVGLIYKVSF